MKISKKRIKQLRKELKQKDKEQIKRKPMRPVFYTSRSLGVGVEIDWGRTSRHIPA